mmetsp:Transcript_24620/g.40827  ORF Transcript_24620/g.40827 Transcript_24620/m.40827 type:complete len:203 (-) Transcript_24620:20-628(-)
MEPSGGLWKSSKSRCLSLTLIALAAVLPTSRVISLSGPVSSLPAAGTFSDLVLRANCSTADADAASSQPFTTRLQKAAPVSSSTARGIWSTCSSTSSVHAVLTLLLENASLVHTISSSSSTAALSETEYSCLSHRFVCAFCTLSVLSFLCCEFIAGCSSVFVSFSVKASRRVICAHAAQRGSCCTPCTPTSSTTDCTSTMVN